MNKEELLKEIMKLPKTKTDNPITTMNSINVDDLMSAVDRLNKVPDYNDLLKENKELKEKLDKYENPEDMTLMMMWCTEKVKDENKELKKQLEDANEKIILLQASEPMLNYKKALEETQQKEFIKYLEDYINSLKKEYGNYVNDNYSEEYGRYYTAKEILQKYKSIIGGEDEKEN